MAAGMLAFAVPGSAVAADGVLIVNGTAYEEPSGCYDSDRWPLSVSNYTDEVALVFSSPGCSGQVIELVNPGDETVSEFGASVYLH
ncbi:hypothetical protein STRAU_4018 [Streptomyces aurantiacus JA 4570]|uniref:Secreted protein n=2 Tax=Streptomyces aurantiacus TaxID=47760 RepID=S3ZJL3_9ACTN|nr:hypothetical protein STRAU_4018 [Streptomyces aurantiacus JA 4570]